MWTPRLPLTAAERHVDYLAHRAHIDSRRVQVEQALQLYARKIAQATVDLEASPHRLVAEFQAAVVRELEQTARFGYRQAQAEIRAHRDATGTHPGLARPVIARYIFPNIGRNGQAARRGLPGLAWLLTHRAAEASAAIVSAVVAQVTANADATRTDLALLATGIANRILHNAVLELVGETLNLGRTAGALDIPDDQGGPPEYAMRSEVMDDNTCDACDSLQGEIVEVDSPDYYDLMPPNECLGGGRCRGVMVYGDVQSDLSLDQAA